MAPRGFVHCRVCSSQASKYTCPSCFIPYCSVTCFKEHKSTFCPNAGPTAPPLEERRGRELGLGAAAGGRPEDESLPETKALRPLTSLKWPYIPEESSYSDPLKRDDPKPLRLRDYEAIASSPAVRSALSSNPTLPALLRGLDKLRGTEREEALESLLGVTDDRATRPKRWGAKPKTKEDAEALKQLAEAIEEAVRGGKADALGLDWTDEKRMETVVATAACR